MKLRYVTPARDLKKRWLLGKPLAFSHGKVTFGNLSPTKTGFIFRAHVFPPDRTNGNSLYQLTRKKLRNYTGLFHMSITSLLMGKGPTCSNTNNPIHVDCSDVEANTKVYSH